MSAMTEAHFHGFEIVSKDLCVFFFVPVIRLIRLVRSTTKDAVNIQREPNATIEII